jgi:RNA polymerase sigma-70 factor (ECF subfamily)
MNQLARNDEEKLIARSQSGDVTAFNQLVLRYQQIVYSTIARLLGDYDIAADITQDTFIAAFRSISGYRGGNSFRSWLLRIGTNLVYDHWRRQQRHPTESLDTLTDEDELHPLSPLETLATTDTASNPEAQLLTHELQELILSGLQHLPLEQRTAIVLCDIQGLSYEEVAQTTQTSLGTVRSRISRARTRLRAYLQDHKELLPRQYRLINSDETH